MNNREIVGLMIKLSIAHRYLISKAANSAGLFYGQPPLMTYISMHSGCTQNELSEQTHVSPPSVAVSVKRMIKSGVLEKQRDEQDARCYRLYLTKKGEETLSHFQKLCDEVDERLFTGFSEEEKASLCGYFTRLTSNISADSLDREEIIGFLDNGKNNKTNSQGKETE